MSEGGGYDHFDIPSIPSGDDYKGNVNTEGSNNYVAQTQQPHKQPGHHGSLIENGQHQHVQNMGQVPAYQPQNYGYQHQNYQSVCSVKVEQPQLRMNQIQMFQSDRNHHGYRTLQSFPSLMASQFGQLGHFPSGHYNQPYPSAGFPGQAGIQYHNGHGMGPATQNPSYSQDQQHPVNFLQYTSQSGKPLSHWPNVQSPALYPETPNSEKCYEHFDPSAIPMIDHHTLKSRDYFNLENNVINPSIPPGHYNPGRLAPVNGPHLADVQEDSIILDNNEMEVEKPVEKPKRKKRANEKRNKEQTEKQEKAVVHSRTYYYKEIKKRDANVAKLLELKKDYEKNEARIIEKKQLILESLGRDPLCEKVHHVLTQTRDDENYKMQLAARKQAEDNFHLAGLDYSHSPCNKLAKAKTKKKHEMETVQTRVDVMEEEFKIAQQVQVLQLYDGCLQSLYFQDPNMPNGQPYPG